MTKLFEVPLYPYKRSPDQDAAAPVRRPAVIIGAGPVGLALAIDLAQADIPVVVLDENDRVSVGSRAICFSKRSLEIFDRLGCGDEMVHKGVVWNTGKVFFGDRRIYEFNLLPEEGHKHPAFINLQQYYCELYLVERIRALQTEGRPVEIRGGNKVVNLVERQDHTVVTIDTPEGAYNIEAEWLVACDGAGSPARKILDQDFVGRVFEDNFLIADVIMKADFPAERWFWFDPPFNKDQSALLHKQPDGVWRIDLQLGWDIDKDEEKKPENVVPRLRQMLGDEVEFELEWVSIYTFQCRRMEQFRHGRVIFAGDSAHQVSPFGARGANSGFQDIDNLGWKLKLVISDKAPETLLDSYSFEREMGADENILQSTRSTDFITPKSEISRMFRDAVLDLSEHYEFARPFVNSGRLSIPCVYENSPLNGSDMESLPLRTRPGSPVPDAPVGDGWLLDELGSDFHLLGLGVAVPEQADFHRIGIKGVNVPAADIGPELKKRYLGDGERAVYLIRPDQHVAARWLELDMNGVEEAMARALAMEEPA